MEAPGAAGLVGCRAGLLDAGVTAAALCRKSSIIVAADESTISWGPSPTFGELVSWSLPGGAEPRVGSLSRLLKMRRKRSCVSLCPCCMQVCSVASAFKEVPLPIR